MNAKASNILHEIKWIIIYVLIVFSIIPVSFKLFFGSFFKYPNPSFFLCHSSLISLVCILYGYHKMHTQKFFNLIKFDFLKELLTVVFPIVIYIIIFLNIMSLKTMQLSSDVINSNFCFNCSYFLKSLITPYNNISSNLKLTIILLVLLILWDMILIIYSYWHKKKKILPKKKNIELNSVSWSWITVDVSGLIIFLVLYKIGFDLNYNEEFLAGGYIAYSIVILFNTWCFIK